ncbi:MAG TPA: LacI family DNA-binding transcriptional regulator [Spirochaetia bacterium]|nr:LacI family DNA-binding transcriptional regulator [Spirochaetia bacterium]
MAIDRLRLVGIAEALELSVTTVSRVLHNKPDVKQETRKRVLEYVQSLGYQTLVGRADLKLVGVVDTFNRHRLSSYYNAHLIDGIDRKLYESGYITTIIHTESIEREQSMFDNVRVLNRLSGVIWLEPVFNQHYHQIISNHNIPCVVINSCEPDIPVDVVECNSYKAARTATEYLLGLGHRAISFIGGQLNYTNILDRLKGYRDAMQDSGIEPDPSLIIEDISLWNDQGGAEGVYRLFSRNREPTAIIVSSDFLLGGVYKAIKELGHSIPGDVSVISFDDSPLAPYLDPPVTSCRQPLGEIGATAADRLVRMIGTAGDDRAPERTQLNMPFIVRSSTGGVHVS